ELEEPLPLPGPEVDAHQALGKEIVAGTMATIEVRRRRFDRQVHEAELFVDADLGPDAGVAIGRPRFLFPRVVAELARPGDGVEGPEQLAGPHVEGAHEPLRVVVRGDRRALAHRRADDHDILGDRRRRVDADFTRLEVNLLALTLDGANL